MCVHERGSTDEGFPCLRARVANLWIRIHASVTRLHENQSGGNTASRSGRTASRIIERNELQGELTETVLHTTEKSARRLVETQYARSSASSNIAENIIVTSDQRRPTPM